LYVKANNVTEELLRNIFNANVSNAKVLSIDIKTNFAFVTVDSTESANNAILELNGNNIIIDFYFTVIIINHILF
jgi:RNA recognition motif-containing protein